MRHLMIVPVGLCLLLSASFCGGQEEINPDKDCVETVSLEGQVMPLITANCAVTGCHNGAESPSLSTSSAIISQSKAINSEVTQGSMPPQGSGYSLSAEEKLAIQCWIAQGSADN